jgi:hypothetical protein
MTTFEMFVILFEPPYGWRNYQDAQEAFQVWETTHPFTKPKG